MRTSDPNPSEPGACQSPLLKPLPIDRLESFILLTLENEDYFAVLDVAHYQFLCRFCKASSNSSTWGDFLNQLEPHEIDFINLFSGRNCDGDEVTVLVEDCWDKVQDLWIFCEGEFPFTQCVEQVYAYYGKCFPVHLDHVEIETEYGQPIRLFPIDQHDNFRSDLEAKGFKVHVGIPPRGLYLVNYR